MTLEYAHEHDLDEVYSILQQHDQIFSFVRKDKIEKHIKRNTCILDSGVVITFTKYKVRRKQLESGTFSPGKGDFWIHQVANRTPGNGKAKEVLQRFLDSCGYKMVFLSVSKSNTRAVEFYKKMGFLFDGEISYNIGGVPTPSFVCVYTPELKAVAEFSCK